MLAHRMHSLTHGREIVTSDNELFNLHAVGNLLFLYRQRAFLVNGLDLWNTCPLMLCLSPQVKTQTIYIRLPDILYTQRLPV